MSEDTVIQADTFLAELLDQLRDARTAEAKARADADELKELIVKEYARLDATRAEFTDRNGRRFVAEMRRDRMPKQVDLDAVHRINPGLYAKITKVQLDSTAFKRAESRGDFDDPSLRATVTQAYKSPSVYFADVTEGGTHAAA